MSDLFNEIMEEISEKNIKISDLEAKLKESEKKAKAYAEEIVFLDKKLENLNKEFELAQEHIEKRLNTGKTNVYNSDSNLLRKRNTHIQAKRLVRLKKTMKVNLKI